MSMAATALSEGFAAIVGPENVVTDSDRLNSYEVVGMIPKIAVRPGTPQEVAGVVRFTSMEKVAIVPVGARTKLGMNIPVPQYHVALDLTRLNRVVAYDPADLTLGVEAGTTLQHLAGVLAEHRQFLPLAVPFADTATVGGTIASGMDSPLRQFYGTARDYVLGMEFVTGEGKLVKSGGRVVKNVSGYDLHKLMIGSIGSLGVITRVNFRTFPVSRSIRGFAGLYESARHAVEARHRIAQSPLRPLSIDILSPRAAQIISGSAATQAKSASMRTTAFSDRHWTLFVTFTGTEKVLERYERDLRQLSGSVDAALFDDASTAASFAQVREFVPLALLSSPAAVILKMSVLPGKIVALLGDAESAVAKADLQWSALVRAVGVIYLELLPRERDDDIGARVAGVIADLSDACRVHGASFNVSWIPREWRPFVSAHKSNRTDLEQMRKIKSVFDPRGVFAPDPLSLWT